MVSYGAGGDCNEPCPTENFSVFLLHETGTVKELRKALPDIPSASLYRHIKILADCSILMVVDENRIRGTVKSVYQLNKEANLLLPAASWLAIMLLIAPAISLVAIAVTVRSSAKAQTIEEAQQRAVFLIFPILALLIGQFTGIILISAGLLWGVGIVLAALAILLVKRAAGNFTYEKLLK